MVLLFCAMTAILSPAQTFTTLSFDVANGKEPLQPPVQGVDGSLYGVAFSGGLNKFGVVFKVTRGGDLESFYNFCSQPNCADGEFPFDLIGGVDGNLYGTTLNGGLMNQGTAFRLTLQGELTSLYSFCSQTDCADGGSPSGFLQATDGNFYGMTLLGGANGAGTIFKLTRQGVLTTLHNFCSQPNCADGYNVNESSASLIQGNDGNFYGTTDIGGSRVGNCGPYGCGTAFKLTPNGEFTTLHTFCPKGDCADGAIPYWLIQGADDYLYGVTGSGGTPNRYGGTIFRLSPNGALTTLYSFCKESGCADGVEPVELVQAAGGGNFYGVTFRGGDCKGACGTAFEITSTGTLTSLHSFDGRDGAYPYGVAQATNGTFYGVTSLGGTDNAGTVFSLATGLQPFVQTLLRQGTPGTRVTILGTNLTGSTAVNFNGAAATFTIVSNTEIRTAVPAGATSGYITVTTPGGTLTSNRPFRVFP